MNPLPNVNAVLDAYEAGRTALATIVTHKRRIIQLIEQVRKERAADWAAIKEHYCTAGHDEPEQNPLFTKPRLVHLHDDDILSVYTEDTYTHSFSYVWTLPQVWLGMDDAALCAVIGKIMDAQLVVVRQWEAKERDREEVEAREQLEALKRRFES